MGVGGTACWCGRCLITRIASHTAPEAARRRPPLRNGWSDPLTALTIVTSPALAPFTVARSLPLAHALPSLCAAPPAAGCHASARASSRSPPPPPEPLACRVSAIGARLFSRRRLRSQHHNAGALAHCAVGAFCHRAHLQRARSLRVLRRARARAICEKLSCAIIMQPLPAPSVSLLSLPGSLPAPCLCCPACLLTVSERKGFQFGVSLHV